MSAKRCFVQLGRIGDILNALPLAKKYRDESGQIPFFMVAGEFASVLDGVSYVQPVIYYGPWDHPLLAMTEARKLTPDLVLCQIHGRFLNNPTRTSSFARESWLSANASDPWGSLPLVIDRRDYDRERKLLGSVLGGYCGRIILFAGKGTSSPFPYEKMLLTALRSNFEPGVQVIDLGEIKAERIFDLLGFFEIADCLIAIDTAHQHLAAAIPGLPVIALATNDPSSWHGSPWRPQHRSRYYYDEIPGKLPEICAEAADAIDRSTWPKIIHAPCLRNLSQFPPETIRRVNTAQNSWRLEYASGRWIKPACNGIALLRDGRDIGDPHPIPFVRDLIERAIAIAGPDPRNIIALTNDDVGFFPGLTGKIFEAVRQRGAAWTHRRDFGFIPSPFVTEASAPDGELYPGTDAFFFSVNWWNHHGAELGDFLIGREFWDEVFRQLIKYHGGTYIPDATWHEIHPNFWDGPDRESIPGNAHNRALREEWFARTGLKPDDYRWWKVMDGERGRA